MALGERARLVLDAEQLGQEVLDMRRERDEEVRLALAANRVASGGNHTLMEPGIGFTQEREERGVDAQQACALV